MQAIKTSEGTSGMKVAWILVMECLAKFLVVLSGMLSDSRPRTVTGNATNVCMDISPISFFCTA